MTDIVERLYEMADDTTHELAAEEITRLRGEIERLREREAAARREGIEAADRAIRAAGFGGEAMSAAIRALLEGSGELGGTRHAVAPEDRHD